MKRLVQILILLLAVMPQYVSAWPTKYKNFCLQADSLCRMGQYEEAKENLESCIRGCPSCKDRYIGDRGCLHMVWIGTVPKTEKGVKSQGKEAPLREDVFSIEMSKQDTMVSIANDPTAMKVDTVITTYYRTDTLYITDNSHLVHPYGIKSWRMEKKTWRWTFNSIGVAAVGGSIGMGIIASRNYQLHAANGASMRREHQQYYKDYKLYSGLMGGCTALAVVAFSANVLYIQVGNDVRIAPGVWVDWQGNAQASLNIKF